MPRERHRSTCTECSLRRQKCDRKVPCSRCVQRGIPDSCTLRWPGGRYDARVHRAYQKSSREAAPHPQVESTLSKGEPRTSERRTTINARVDKYLDSDEELEGLGVSVKRLAYSFEPYEPTNLREQKLHNDFSLTHDASAPTAYLQMLLPNVDHIWKLVDYHELYLLWYHGCYHGPTLRWELQSVLASQKTHRALDTTGLNLQWLALLFSIMAGSLTCAVDWRLEEWGFSKPEVATLSSKWYKAAITCLNCAEWTSNHSIYAVHAIATLTMSAHSLGKSGELGVLLGAAHKIAQSLGLDRLEQNPELETITESSTGEQRHRFLKREVGRRIWSQLCVQDWMSLPFTESHSINPRDFTTMKPSSRNHLNMEPIATTYPTYISYGNYLFEIAKLMVAHHQATVQATTPYTRYEQVLEYDSRMRQLATKGMPRYFHVVEPIDRTWPEWVSWARRSLTICFAHKMIMIHRHFINQSFTNPAYSVTRTTCVAAAKTILNEAKQTKDDDGPIIWIDKAFCLVAGIVLCLDISHRPESDSDFNFHKSLVTDCIQSFERYKASAIAIEGVKLLKWLLAERNKMASNLTWPPESIEVSNVLQSLTDTGMNQQQDSMGELLPPQAGFRNSFIFDTLLGLK